jgi:hypothetical protein
MASSVQAELIDRRERMTAGRDQHVPGEPDMQGADIAGLAGKIMLDIAERAHQPVTAPLESRSDVVSRNQNLADDFRQLRPIPDPVPHRPDRDVQVRPEEPVGCPHQVAQHGQGYFPYAPVGAEAVGADQSAGECLGHGKRAVLQGVAGHQ